MKTGLSLMDLLVIGLAGRNRATQKERVRRIITQSQARAGGIARQRRPNAGCTLGPQGTNRPRGLWRSLHQRLAGAREVTKWKTAKPAWAGWCLPESCS